MNISLNASVRPLQPRLSLQSLLLMLVALLMLTLAPGLSQAQEARKDYVLGSGDVIRINVYQNQDLTLETRINESGRISYPLLGQLKLGGLSVTEAERTISDGLFKGNFLRQPQVSILVMQVRGNQASVLGVVNRPGRYPIEVTGMRMSELLAAAGGVAAGGSDTVSLSGQREGPCLLLPKQYTAGTAVVVDVKSPDPIMGMVLPAMVAPGYMATQVDIIQSDKVAQRVVKMLKLDQNPKVQEDWREDTEGQGSIEAWLGALLKKKLDVKPSRESNVITINYTATDGKFAQVIANAFAQAYIETNIELRVEPAKQYATWFDARSKQLRDGLEAAQAKLSAYQREKGIVALDERLDIEKWKPRSAPTTRWCSASARRTWRARTPRPTSPS
jgi:hypothetical protein